MLPEKFLERMRGLLKDDYPAFLLALEGDAVKGCRINRMKLPSGGEDMPFLGAALPYYSGGFLLDSDVQIGRTPEHHAGMIYVQDPGAMCTLGAIDIQDDWWVADLCAAPGGKSSQAAEHLKEGFLLSNEFVPKRAKITVGNLERLGARRAMVTSLDTGELAEMFEGVFDLVIADAPCSGEGMFRKSEEAKEEWSEENVLACAKRQSYILDNAAGMVKDGGYLLYSTCTYSCEENERAVLSFLERNPQFSISPVKEELRAVTCDGYPQADLDNHGIEHTRRFYPHRSPGEGQYLALLKKRDDGKAGRICYKEKTTLPSKDEQRIVGDFFRENLIKAPEGRLIKNGDTIVLIQHGCPIPQRGVFMSGIAVGEIRGKLLVPHHQLFSALGDHFKVKIDLSESLAEKYLLGEEIGTDSTHRGYCVLTYRSVAIGGGKISDFRIKNHYPKGLRNNR